MSNSATSYTGSVKISSLSTTNSADLYYYDNCILNIQLNENIFTSTSTSNITNLNVAYYALTDNINDSWENISYSEYITSNTQKNNILSVSFRIPPFAIPVQDTQNNKYFYKFKFIIEYTKEDKTYTLDSTNSNCYVDNNIYDKFKSSFNISVDIAKLTSARLLFTNGNVLFDREHVEQISINANKIYNFIKTGETSDEEIKKDLTVISGVSYFLNNTNFRNFADPNYRRYIKTTWNVFVPFGYDNDRPIEGAEYYNPKLNYKVYGIMIQSDKDGETEIKVPLNINTKGELGYSEIRKFETGSVKTWNTKLFDTSYKSMYAKDGPEQLRVIDGYYTYFHVFLDIFGNPVETTESDKEVINGKQLYKKDSKIYKLEYDTSGETYKEINEKNKLTHNLELDGVVYYVSGGQLYKTENKETSFSFSQSSLAYPYVKFNTISTDGVDDSYAHTLVSETFEIYAKEALDLVLSTEQDVIWTGEDLLFKLECNTPLDETISITLNNNVFTENDPKWEVVSNDIVTIDEFKYYKDHNGNITSASVDMEIKNVIEAYETSYMAIASYYGVEFTSNIISPNIKLSASIISQFVDENNKDREITVDRPRPDGESEEIVYINEIDIEENLPFTEEYSVYAEGDDLVYQWQRGVTQKQLNPETGVLENIIVWENIPYTSSRLVLTFENLILRGNYYQCIVYNKGRPVEYWQYTNMIHIRSILYSNMDKTMDKNLLVCKFDTTDFSDKTIDIKDNYMLYTNVYNDAVYTNNMSTPTVLTRNDFSVLPWTDSKDGSEPPIEKLYQFPTDFDIDKITNNYAVASDVSKQRVYVFNILKTDRPDRLEYPICIIDAPEGSVKFGYKVFMNNNIICVSDIYASGKTNNTPNVGCVHVYYFNSTNNTYAKVSTLYPDIEIENLSFGENIEFDSNNNILISATEEPYTNIYNYAEDNETIYPVKNKSKYTKEIEVTTTGVVYVFNSNYTRIAKLNSHKLINQIDTDKGSFGNIEIYRSGLYTVKFKDYLGNIKIHNFSELPKNNIVGSAQSSSTTKLALYNNWYNTIYQYDFSFRTSVYCKYINIQKYNGDVAQIYLGRVNSNGVLDDNGNHVNELGSTEFIAVGGNIVNANHIRFSTYFGYDDNDFKNGDTHGYVDIELSKSNTYSIKQHFGFFGSSISFSNYGSGKSGILAIGAPYYYGKSEMVELDVSNNFKYGFVDLYKFNYSSNRYDYYKTIENPIPNSLNFGLEVEVSSTCLLISYDLYNEGNKVKGILIYKISNAGEIDTNNYINKIEDGTVDFGYSIDSYGSNIVVTAPKSGKIFRYTYNETSVGGDTNSELQYIQSIESETLSDAMYAYKAYINGTGCFVSYNSYTLNDHNSNIPGNGAILQYTDLGGKYTLL